MNLHNRFHPALAFVAVITLAGCSIAEPRPVADVSVVQLESQSPIVDESQSMELLPEDSPDDQRVVFDPEAELEIDDQTGDGLRVVLDDVETGRSDTFLVIYDSSGLVRATMLISPTYLPVSIRLSPGLESSQTLQAVFYLDDGDGDFELDQDSPMIDEDGDLIYESFKYEISGK